MTLPTDPLATAIDSPSISLEAALTSARARRLDVACRFRDSVIRA